jgi:hypothetical protein
MNSWNIKVGDIFYYFWLEAHALTFMKVEAIRRDRFKILEIYSTNRSYTVDSETRLRFNRLYKNFSTPLKKAIKYGVQYSIVESIFDGGGYHNTIRDYAIGFDGESKVAIKGWEKHF